MLYISLTIGIVVLIFILVKFPSGASERIFEEIQKTKDIVLQKQQELLQVQSSLDTVMADITSTKASLAAAGEQQQHLLQEKQHWFHHSNFVTQQSVSEDSALDLLSMNSELNEQTLFGLNDITHEQQEERNWQVLEEQQQLMNESMLQHEAAPDMIVDEMEKGHANGMGFHPFDDEHISVQDEINREEDSQHFTEMTSPYGEDDYVNNDDYDLCDPYQDDDNDDHYYDHHDPYHD